MIVKNVYDVGDFVISVTDKKRRKMIVTGLMIRESGILYYCTAYDNEQPFYACELESWVEEEIKAERGTFRPLTVKYLKSLDYEPYINLLKANDTGTVKEIIKMLVGAEEYEMAEVTKRYLDR